MKQAQDLLRDHPEAQFIETVKGHKFFLRTPRFDIDEIAHALGQKCRYNGHCRRFYSVAEHSLLVAHIMETLGLGDPFMGLMHDAHEAYIPDMPSAWKALLPDFCALEKSLEAKLHAAYNLGNHSHAGVKKADWIALAIEAKQLMATKGEFWLMPEGIQLEVNKFLHVKINGYEPEVARDHFLVAFAELAGPRGIAR